MSLLVLRGIFAPFLLLCGIIALAFVRGRMASPARELLLAFWGSTALLSVDIVATVTLLVADETPAQLAGDASFTLIVGACGLLSVTLGLVLGWRVRVAGERFLIALVRPPTNLTRKVRGGWAMLPLLLLLLGESLVVFSATNGLLSHLRLGG